MVWSLGDDYYAMLGVHCGADQVELRRAWRLMAVRWHPDRAGAAATAMFTRMAAAYEVLSDPLARAAYDRRRRTTENGATVNATTEHATTEHAGAPPAAKPTAARRAAPAIMLERLCTHLSTLIACAVAEVEDDGTITLVLRDDEAAQGGMATIPMYVEVWCPQCSPHGQARATTQGPAHCVRCGGTRTLEELYAAWLAIPPGAAAGEVLIPSADLPGMVAPVRFRVRLRGTG